MLDICDRSQVAPVWSEISSRAVLPKSEGEFFGKKGPTPLMPDTRRRFHRMYLRLEAVLRYENQYHAVYLVDLSRSGVGIVSPVQLFPRAPLELGLPDGRDLVLETKWCVRLGANCYHAGGEFVGQS